MVKGIFDVLSSCIGVVIPFESCLTTNFLQNLLATQRISFDFDHCTFPTFADGEMKMILSDAIKSCNHKNNDIVTTGVDFITTNLEVIFRNDICLKAACKEVKGFSKKIESAMKEEYMAVKNKFLEVTSDCSGEKFSINDCAVSSALDLLFQGTTFFNTDMIETQEGNETRFLKKNPSSNGHKRKSLEEYKKSGSINHRELCSIFPLEKKAILKIVQGAELVCKHQNDKDITGIADIRSTIKAMFQNNSCLSTFCTGGLEFDFAADRLHKSDVTNRFNKNGTFVNTTSTKVIVAAEYFFECASIETTSGSCITTSFLDELKNFIELNTTTSSIIGTHDTTAVVKTNNRRKLQTSTKTPTANPSTAPSPQPTFVCPMTKPKFFQKHELIQRARQPCSNNEESFHELIKAHHDIQKILHADYCWDQICSEDSFSTIVDQYLVENNINASAADTKDISINFMIQCATIEIDNSSCVRSSLLDEVKYYEESNRRLTRNRRLRSTKMPGELHYLTHAPRQSFEPSKPSRASTKAPTPSSVVSYPTKSPYTSNVPSKSHEECMITKPDDKTVMLLLNNAIDRCNSDGKISSDQLLEAEELLTKLTQADNCWKRICSDDDTFLGLSTLDQCLGLSTIALYNKFPTNNNSMNLEFDKVTCMRKKILADLTTKNLCLSSFQTEIKSACFTKLGPAAYEFCNERQISGTIEDRDELISDLCFEFEKINSEKGQQCLKPYCKKKSLVWPSIAPNSPMTSNEDVLVVTPSQPPSINSKKLNVGLLEILFEASVSLSSISFDVETQNILEFNSMLNILRDAIMELLPSESKTFRVLSFGGVPVPTEILFRRRLEDVVVVEFQFIILSECEKVQCESSHYSSGIIIQNTRKKLESAVSSGELAASIRVKSIETSLKIFEDVEVKSISIKNTATKIDMSATDKYEYTSAASKMFVPLFTLYGVYAVIMYNVSCKLY